MRWTMIFGLLGMLSATALAQAPAARVAAYESLQVPRAKQTITFAKRAAEAGDRVDQTLRVQLDLESTVRQGDTELDKSSTSMLREQDRTVIAEEIRDGRSVAARVRFAKYLRTINGQTNEPPVVGNTYVCRRLEDDSLSVTRDDGSFANPDEFGVVSESMDSLGRPNPLADYLADKTVAVGDKLQVPQEVGAQLLGSNNSLGEVSKFVLSLRGVAAETKVATFDIEMETQGTQQTQMRLMVTGELDVDPQTCRTVRMTMDGPLAMATTMGSYSTAQTTYVRGKLHLEMTAAYD